MERIIAAFDPGFQFSKGYSQFGEYMCLARAVEVDHIDKQEGVTIIELEGKTYQVGDGLNIAPDLNHDKTQSNKTKVELFNYLHQICDGTKGKFLIATGTPLSKSQTEDGLPQQLINYFKTDGYILVKRNGIEKEICVEQVVAMPQAIITYYSLPVELREKYRNENTTVLIWDIGGHTFDVAEFIGGIPQILPDTKLYTRNTGIIPMLIDFKKKLDYKYPTYDFKTTEELRKIFEKGYFPDATSTVDVSKIIEQVGRDHVQKLVNEMKMVFSPATADENILCGGGSITLEKHIQEFFPKAKLIEDAQFSNVKAMYKTLENHKINNSLLGGIQVG